MVSKGELWSQYKSALKVAQTELQKEIDYLNNELRARLAVLRNLSSESSIPQKLVDVNKAERKRININHKRDNKDFQPLFDKLIRIAGKETELMRNYISNVRSEVSILRQEITDLEELLKLLNGQKDMNLDGVSDRLEEAQRKFDEIDEKYKNDAKLEEMHKALKAEAEAISKRVYSQAA